ncbi:MAG TPA: hypothetical protein VME17_24250 [Bryobacteraceae bacterium]|nr:hypothetical protein [Bryobacteraceae bacterium]
MNAHRISEVFSLRYLRGMAVLLLACSIVNADNKKPSAPAKPAAKPAAARPAAARPAAGRPATAARPAAGRPATTARPAAAGARPGAAAGARPAAGRPATAARPSPAGTRTARAANGSEVRTRANGSRADVHDARRGMDVHHGLNGSRRVSVERADHSRIVAERGGRGYVQHPYRYHGHDFAHRTYYYHGRAYDRFYRGYYYHGAYVEMYAPGFYYQPAFYGWAYNPWAVPIAYPIAAWGWAGNPWYGYYGGFFAPYPVYASASLWLTDYMISQSLSAAYQAQADAAAAAQAQALANPAPLTPQVKDLISAEVQRQIALENAEAQVGKTGDQDPASSGIQRMLTDNVRHVFVAGKDMDVVDAAGTECAISEGDALQLTGQPAAADSASLAVLASKGGNECQRGDTVSVTFVDLQDMQNHMRETIDEGMGQLQAKQGQGGLPALPPSAAAPPQKTDLAMNAPPPDPDAANQINQQWSDSNKAEQEVATEVAPAGGQAAGAPAPIPAPQAPPVNIDTGQSIDQVTTALGQPKSIVNLGAKKIYVYPDMKITFKDGKVSDVQ